MKTFLGLMLQIRGKSVDEAIKQLSFHKKKAAALLKDVGIIYF